MSGTDDERRRYPRHHLAGVVEYSGGEGVRCNEIINIGMGGVRLELTAAERPGTRVELRIALEQGEPITVVGQVVWARTREPYEAGIRFLEVDASKLEAAL
jgi:hypothetical protein